MNESLLILFHLDLYNKLETKQGFVRRVQLLVSLHELNAIE